MRKVLLVLCLFLVASLVSFGCTDLLNKDIAGLWVDPDNPRTFVKINGDGTYLTVLGIEGEWERHGDEITFITEFGLATFRIEGNKLISPNQVYIKKE